ncbi:hypothetical protein EsH8_I_001171 [Colletotrichum jinshuiense]
MTRIKGAMALLCRIIANLSKNGRIKSVADIEGKWESYTQELVHNPLPGVSLALVVVGSDKRGTIYGLYSISEAIGVSPWYWWADVPITPTETLYFDPRGKIQDPPSIKYRGIFINDEEQCLTGWASSRFALAGGDQRRPFTSEFYKRVFELILRLKANYIWPAMKYSMFYVDDANNGKLADDYGIVVGSSHHEPMARAYVEQTRYVSGPWDWSKNSENITKFMSVGVERSRNWETLYTMGMRGEGDLESPTLTAPQLEEILKVQQESISKTLSVDISTIPQTWVLYKEVGKYYQAGMQVPEDVTMMFTDDNYGNLLRIPYPNEASRSSGVGIYYHLNYVGRPRQYEWINTVQLIKTWEQMQLAYDKQAREIWVVNIGDIKPLTFNSAVGNAIADILNRYGLLLARRKYETLNMPPFVYSTSHYDEAEKALAEWNSLLNDAMRVYNMLGAIYKAAFYEMVLHPIEAGQAVNELYIKTEIGRRYATQHRTSTNKLAADARAAFARDTEISAKYNSINDGKWNGIMCQVHIGLTTWYESKTDNLPRLSYIGDSTVPKSGIMGIAGQGDVLPASSNNLSIVLLPMSPYMPPTEKRWLDVFTRANGTFLYNIHSNVSWVSISNPTGNLSSPGNFSDARSIIKVDWSSAPAGKSQAALSVQRLGGSSSDTATAYLPLFNPSVSKQQLKGRYVESNGVVAIEAAHYSRVADKSGIRLAKLPYYGRTLSGIKNLPVTAPSLTVSTAPKVSYDFYTSSGGAENANASLRVYLGGSRNHDGTRPLKYAFAVDNRDIVTVEPVQNNPMGSDPEGWADSVIVGGWNVTSPIDGGLKPGPHSLDLWLLEPGVVVQKVVIDLGGVLGNGLVHPESYKA